MNIIIKILVKIQEKNLKVDIITELFWDHKQPKQLYFRAGNYIRKKRDSKIKRFFK